VAIHPGDILAGCRVTRLLGRGGMGEVWGAVDEAHGNRDVAVKVLLPRAAMKPDLVKRFEREAKITSAINSPYVCKLLRVENASDNTHYLIFEQLTGESLADRLKREQYLPLSEVGPMLEDVLKGLAAAHAASVIHRDLKPGNIFIERTSDPRKPERAKILDFGISKLTAKEKGEPTLTAFDATLGSFAYMAPEQIRGAARADERADIYAIGAVAFRALTGRLPFEGTTAAILVSLKLDRNAPSLEQVTGEKWPAGVERFLERALDRNRESRFKSAHEALEAWRAIQPRNITKVAVPPSQTGNTPLSLKGIGVPSLSFAESSNEQPNEDMPTEVDDPPTMTGNHSFPGYATTGSQRAFADPKTSDSRNVPRPTSSRRQSVRQQPAVAPESSARPLSQEKTERMVRQPTRPPTNPGRGIVDEPTNDPKGGGPPRSKRMRNGGR